MAEDVSRNGFDPARRYLGVRLQQGRVWVDADFNEQADIVHQRLKETALDVIGAAGAPAGDGGFAVEADNVLVFDGRHAAFAAPARDLRFADRPFMLEVCCEPSPGEPFGGTLLCATDTHGHVHFSLGLDGAGNVVVEHHGERVLVAPLCWGGPRLLRVVYDGLVLGVSADDEHAAHAHTEVAGAVLDFDDVELDRDAPRTRPSAARPPVGVLVGMGWVRGERRAGFRGSIGSIRIFAGTDEASPAVACWPLDEGTGTLAADTSGHGHHLQLDYGERTAHPRWLTRSLSVSAGRFYVDGLVCQAPERTALVLPARRDAASDGASLVYLDVWERVMTAAEEPRLRDPALGGVDTAARLRLHHCVRSVDIGDDPLVEPDSNVTERAWRRVSRRHRSGALRVRSTQPSRLRDGYYRVEIHHSGGRVEGGDTSRVGCRARPRESEGRLLQLGRGARTAWVVGQWCAAAGWSARIVALHEGGSVLEVSSPLPASFGTHELWLRPLATFKWSRNNGSEQWTVRHAEGQGVRLLPAPGRRLDVGDLVEISDRRRRELGEPGVISSVAQAFDGGQRLVLADALPALGPGLVLTRWHGQALLPVSGKWTALEHGIEVQFGGHASHHAGEGWGFATREADGSLDWPVRAPSQDPGAPDDAGAAKAAGAGAAVPAWQRPRDGRHHLAPLALVRHAGAGVSVRDLRRSFAPLGTSARGPDRPEPSPEPRPHVETIRHIGRETQIDDGVIHARQLADDVGVVPVGTCILSEHARPPAGFARTGQSLRVPAADPTWRRVSELPAALEGPLVLLESPSARFALAPNGPVWRSSHADERWRVVAEMPEELYDFGAALRGERLHVVGGRREDGPPVASHWVLEGGRWHERAPLAVARAGLRLEVLAGRLVALGGLKCAFSPWWRREHTTARVEAYDAARDCWRALPSLPRAVAHAASIVQHGRLRMIGGRTVPLLGRPRTLDEHFELAAPSAQWVRRERLARARARAATARLGDDVYLVGGESDDGALADVERYLAALDRWEPRAPLPEPVSGAALLAEQGTLACFGAAPSERSSTVGWVCRFETALFVHRRLGSEDLASGQAATPDVADSAARLPSSTTPGTLRETTAPGARDEAPLAAATVGTASVADAAPTPPGAAAPAAAAPPAAATPTPAAAAPPSSTPTDAAPPSSTSAVVAPQPAASAPTKAARVALPEAIAKPALGLVAQVGEAAKKLKQALPVAALAAAAGLLGSGRAPELLDEAREQLIVWLTPANADAPSASTAANGSAGAPAAPATSASSASSSSAPANAPSSAPANPSAPAPATTAPRPALDLGDTSALYARGVDVSHYQGDVPWEAIAYDGVDYAFTKATQGTTYRDPSFDANWAAIRDHGLLRGAYHVWEPDQDPVAQAKFFVSAIGKDTDLPPVLDVELVPMKKKTCPQLLSDIQKFAQTVEQALDQVIAIYSYADYWQTYLTCNDDAKAAAITQSLALRPLWVADFQSKQDPQLFGGRYGWVFWQYRSNGNDGKGRVDLDRFNGGPQDLRRWLTRRMRPPVP